MVWCLTIFKIEVQVVHNRCPNLLFRRNDEPNQLKFSQTIELGLKLTDLNLLRKVFSFNNEIEKKLKWMVLGWGGVGA